MLPIHQLIKEKLIIEAMGISQRIVRSKKQHAQELLRSNRLDEAYAIYQYICDQDQNDPDCWIMLGLISSQKGKYDEAARFYTNACRLVPNNTRARYNLGAVLCAQGRLDEAESALRTTISTEPDHQPAWTLLGHVLSMQNRPEEAEQVYSSAVERFSDNTLLLANYAATLLKRGRLVEAARLCRTSIKLSPTTAWYHDLLGSILSQQGLQKQAEQHHAKAVSLDPNKRRYHSNWLLQQHYLESGSRVDLVAAHRDWPGNRGQQRRNDYPNDPRPDRKLRVGYLSQDLRKHSVAYFAQNLFGANMHDDMEFYCYADGPSDEMTDKLATLADHWRSVSTLNEEAVANLIKSDCIDILVELNGHTSDRILSVAALQPAPVQVTYLGYPDTTGLAAIDYRITDDVADPAGTENTCTEKLARIPGCFLCYKAPDDSPEVVPVPCVNNGYFTFGSFNNVAKINDRVIELWARLLLFVPGSRLCLKNRSLDDEDVRARITSWFADHGINDDRLILRGSESSTRGHLSRYADIDVGLDTFPYCGTTTTCEALWMGVPVITLSGSSHAGRVGTSLMKAVGHPEWIAGSPDEYIDIAARLAEDIRGLECLRAGLRGQMAGSILCDSSRFAGVVSQAYREMWHVWIKGRDGL